ncbi:serine O-acetyltransferase [Algoriphagus lacus]|uniref:serine O-acetyltransferase n=1 Tax=Algoriphagus lacus TaxID=2056311 RepID=UPI0018F3A06F|nr:serine acetyltransferase [Algoriphagus lacus]
MIARIFLHINKSSYGIQIPHITKIGKGLFIGHYGAIVVSNEAVIGDNCNLAQGSTIGRINKGPRKGAPKIGNRVWIGANAVLVGNISIGDNVLIAPLSFVNFDVPANSMVLGNPAQIIEGKTSEDYINFHF